VSVKFRTSAVCISVLLENFRICTASPRVPTSILHRILQKSIYTGEFDYAGATYQGSHEPLVTREIWEPVQEVLSGWHEKKHREVAHDFASPD
jgi:hypothetical protein